MGKHKYALLNTKPHENTNPSKKLGMICHLPNIQQNTLARLRSVSYTAMKGIP